MNRRNISIMATAIAIIISILLGLYFTKPNARPLTIPEQIPAATILLLPLDSRPPCTEFVEDLARIANLKILLPPRHLLDQYRRPGDKQALAEWLSNNISRCDAAIISADMLMSGGLIASRHLTESKADGDRLIQLLRELHAAAPTVPIHLFHILPRLWLHDRPDAEPWGQDLLEYSQILEQVYLFTEQSTLRRLAELKDKLPPNLLDDYHNFYERNYEINKRLCELTKNGDIASLTIAQDDGDIFGLPNVYAHKIGNYIDRRIAPAKIAVTRGADEVALTLLAAVNNDLRRHKPTVHVQYSDAAAPNVIMPFMPISVVAAVEDKLRLLNCRQTDDINAADFTLYVYIGTTTNVEQRFRRNRDIQALLEHGRRVALVDLSEHFQGGETIFPVLWSNAAPLERLIAYAGWNTTSNSIATALAQASVFTASLRDAAQDPVAVYYHNLTFLNKRFIEDWFYQKKVIDQINGSLADSGIDRYELGGSRAASNAAMNAALNREAYLFKNSKAAKKSLSIDRYGQPLTVRISDLSIDASFPWSRTFEIDLDMNIFLEIVEK